LNGDSTTSNLEERSRDEIKHGGLCPASREVPCFESFRINSSQVWKVGTTPFPLLLRRSRVIWRKADGSPIIYDQRMG
jgi:hypothetical protein